VRPPPKCSNQSPVTLASKKIEYPQLPHAAYPNWNSVRASVLSIHHPVISVQILPGREILGSRLEHPRPVAFLRQHPRRPNGYIIWYFNWHDLALEMGLPDTLNGEVI